MLQSVATFTPRFELQTFRALRKLSIFSTTVLAPPTIYALLF
jgi:hypothetical protein